MMTAVTIRKAEVTEVRQLSELALRSKAHWGYSAEFVDACREELLVTEDHLAKRDFHCYVAVCEEDVAGFASVARVSQGDWELHALFVEPENMGIGIGRALMNHAKSLVIKNGGLNLLVQGDPHAEGFYLANDAVRIGERESGSIPGRMLPMFNISLSQ